MKLIKSEKGINLVDDSYNSNPEGVLAALDYLKVFSGKKIIVLQPLIELGRATFGAHRRVLKRAARVCDLIFLTNRNYRCQIMAGAEDWSQKKIKVAKSPHRVMKDYFSDLKKGDVILFEGREAQHYLKLMK